MASPRNGGSGCPTDSDSGGAPYPVNTQDSGFHELSSVSVDSTGTGSLLEVADGASCHADCIYKIPAIENQLTELADESLSTYECGSKTESKIHPDGSKSYDLSTRLNADSGLSSGATSGTSGTERRQSKIPSNLNAKGELPCDIFHIDEKTKSLQRFETFNELSGYLIDSAAEHVVDNAMRVESRDFQSVLEKMVRMPLESIGSYIVVGEYLRYLYEKDMLMDVVVHIKDRTFSAHRVALSCYSDYFKDLFNSNKGKQIPFEMRLRGITPEAFAVFLEFIYTGQLQIYDAIAADLITIADYLKVDVLKQRYNDLAERLPLDQALKLVVKSQGESYGRIYRNVLNRTVQNFTEISQLPDMLELDIDTLCQLLSSDDLVVQTEFDVFQLAVRWLVHNIEERVKFSLRIMNLVRFCYMTTEELFTCAETTSLIRGYDKFREAILIVNWILTARLLKRHDPFKFPIPPPRNCYLTQFSETGTQPGQYSNRDNFPPEAISKIVPTSGEQHTPIPVPLMTSTPKTSSGKHENPEKLPTKLQSQAQAKSQSRAVDLLVIGGFHSDKDETVERYDSEDNQWVPFCRLPEPRRHHAVALMGSKLYLIGGSDPRTPGAAPVPTKSVFVLDLSNKEWQKVSDLNVPRMSHCVCTLLGKIYAIGGNGMNINTLDSVECYNPITDNWFFVMSLSTARSSAAATILSEKIYVVGGLGASTDVPSTLNVLDKVEVFDPTHNSWSARKNLRFPRCNASLVNVKDRLYLCGGATRSYDYKNSVLTSVASLDEYIEEHDMWCHRTDMIIPRHDAGVTVAGERIYIAGGISSTADRVLQSIECYDTRRALWLNGVQDLPYPTRWICCVTVTSKY